MDPISLYLTRCLAAHNGHSKGCSFHFKLKHTFSHMSMSLVAFIPAFFSELVGKVKKFTDLFIRNALICEHIGETIFISDLKLLTWTKMHKMMNPPLFLPKYFFITAKKCKITTLKCNQKLTLWDTGSCHISVRQFVSIYQNFKFTYCLSHFASRNTPVYPMEGLQNYAKIHYKDVCCSVCIN